MNENAAMSRSPRLLRLLRIRLRTFFLLTCLLCIGLALLAARLQSARKQRLLREELVSHHWVVRHEWNSDPMAKSFLPVDRVRPPAWAVQLLGPDFFDPVTWVISPYGDQKATGRDFECISNAIVQCRTGGTEISGLLTGK